MDLVTRLDLIEQKPLEDGYGHHGGRLWEVFTAETIGTEALRLLVQEYGPGGYTKDHPIHTRNEQAYYVVEGEMTVEIDGVEHQAAAGSFVFIPRGARHDHRNAGTGRLVFLTINVPVRDGEVPPVRHHAPGRP